MSMNAAPTRKGTSADSARSSGRRDDPAFLDSTYAATAGLGKWDGHR
jgi:hypothetical protein